MVNGQSQKAKFQFTTHVSSFILFLTFPDPLNNLRCSLQFKKRIGHNLLRVTFHLSHFWTCYVEYNSRNARICQWRPEFDEILNKCHKKAQRPQKNEFWQTLTYKCLFSYLEASYVFRFSKKSRKKTLGFFVTSSEKQKIVFFDCFRGLACLFCMFRTLLI